MVTSNKEKAPRQTKAKQIRVLIVDDHEVVRVGLQTLLRLVPEMQVVGEAGTMSEAVSQARTLNPNVILMDIRLPDGSGVDACREIRTACPDTKVLFLTSYADEDTVLDAILSGAHGYVLKEIGANSLIEAIQTVADRGWVRGVPAILRRLETEQDDFVRGVTLRALKRLESGVG